MYFNGNCREAVEYYAQIFETEKPQFMAYGDNPPNPEYSLPEAAKNLIMHSRLNINGSNVMFSDVFPGSPFTVGNNISLAYVSKDIDQVKQLFNKLQDGGSVKMELQETFWSKCYGNLRDKFGIEWQMSYESE
nr:VOC family protein [Paenibacillus sp. 79R4]